MTDNIFDASGEDSYNPKLSEAANAARAAYRDERHKGSPTMNSRDPSDPVSLQPMENETLASKLMLGLGLSWDELAEARSRDGYALAYDPSRKDVKSVIQEIAGESLPGDLESNLGTEAYGTTFRFDWTHNKEAGYVHRAQQGDESVEIVRLTPLEVGWGQEQHPPIAIIRYSVKGSDFSLTEADRDAMWGSDEPDEPPASSQRRPSDGLFRL